MVETPQLSWLWPYEVYPRGIMVNRIIMHHGRNYPIMVDFVASLTPAYIIYTYILYIDIHPAERITTAGQDLLHKILQNVSQLQDRIYCTRSCKTYRNGRTGSTAQDPAKHITTAGQDLLHKILQNISQRQDRIYSCDKILQNISQQDRV